MPTSSLSLTTEFREEFEAERTDWLRRRFLWYAGIGSALTTLVFLVNTVGRFILIPPSLWWLVSLIGLIDLATCALFVGYFVKVKRRHADLGRDAILRIVTIIIIAAGLLNLAETPVAASLVRQIATIERADPLSEPPTPSSAESHTPPGPANAATSKGQPAPTVGDTSDDDRNVRFSFEPTQAQAAAFDSPVELVATWGAQLLVIHLIASLFIPWTPRESCRPLIPLVVCGVIFVLLNAAIDANQSWLQAAVVIAFLPLIGLPGAGIAWLRHSRFRTTFGHKMLRGRYSELKRELVDARRIHEALFPPEIHEGTIRLSFRYEPMRQIGGDFLFARRVFADGKEDALDVILLDVTGHGISAALTVNRLAGEIEREIGERHETTPGELLHGLNAYLHHTLAIHSVYATAICLRVDPNTDTVRWASAGHPPAFLRSVDGRLDRLESTTLMLGACRAEDFEPNEAEKPLAAGDRVLAYTDGATEARNETGRMLRVEGMQRLVASISPADLDGSWSAELLHAVDRYRHGPVQDDTLIVEVGRPV